MSAANHVGFDVAAQAAARDCQIAQSISPAAVAMKAQFTFTIAQLLCSCTIEYISISKKICLNFKSGQIVLNLPQLQKWSNSFWPEFDVKHCGQNKIISKMSSKDFSVHYRHTEVLGFQYHNFNKR